MHYESNLQFFQKLLKNLGIPVRIFTDLQDDFIESTLYGSYSNIINMTLKERQEMLLKVCKPNCFLRIYDPFLCNYIIFQLPDTEPTTFVTVGPYTKTLISKKDILDIADTWKLDVSQFQALEKYYNTMPMLSDESYFVALLHTLGESLWGSTENYTMELLQEDESFLLQPMVDSVPIKQHEDPRHAMILLEEIYNSENQFLKAISLGQIHKTEEFFANSRINNMEQRVSNPIRNFKNYSIVFNTLLRKAAELGGVHPLHIDSISSLFAKKIEAISSEKAFAALQKEMVRKYCYLVKNHSLKSYSVIIKKVLTNIDADLTSDLSLNAQATLFNVNASYLSNLFKKETGSTLTSYVNQKRIDHAILLLNTTSMQIQTIAQYCGIPDINYFTKTFKKYIGKTPQEYRKSITRKTSS